MSKSRASAQTERTVYPFSLVPGGVRDAAEVAAVRVTDAVVRSHYSDVGARLTSETMPRDQWLYTSYRVGTSVYWTKHTVRVRAGETVLSDGAHMIRGRCGNRLSAVPKKPTRIIDPPSILEDTPTVVTEVPPRDVPFETPGGDPGDTPVDLPVRPGTPLLTPVPSSVTPKPQITGTRRAITGPYAALLPAPHNTVATVEAPEPATWAMMLAGLAILGFIARRSRKPARS